MFSKISEIKIKVLIADDNKFERQNLYEFLSSLEQIDSIDCACNGSETIKKILSKNYDLLILDFVMENTDGLEVLDFINKNKLKKLLKIIIVSAVGKAEIIKKAFEKGTDYYLKKSFNFEHLKNIIFDLFYKNNLKKLECENLIVTELGIPANLLGSRYICQILKIIKHENISISEAYRIVAKYNNTSDECVEINIRNAIKYAHKIQNNYYIKLFGNNNNNKKPKNSVFLHTIAKINYLN